MSFEDIQKVLVKKNLLNKYNIHKIGVFGSIARGQEAQDVDFFVEQIEDYKKLIAFKNEVEAITNLHVDIMIKKYANPIVLHRAMKDMRYV